MGKKKNVSKTLTSPTVATPPESAPTEIASSSSHQAPDNLSTSSSPKEISIGLNTTQCQRFDTLMQPLGGLIKGKRDAIHQQLFQQFGMLPQDPQPFYLQYDVAFLVSNYLQWMTNALPPALEAHSPVLCGGAVLNILADIPHADVDFIMQIKELTPTTIQTMTEMTHQYFANHPGFLRLNKQYDIYIKHIVLDSGGEFILCRFGAPPNSNISGIDIKFVTSLNGLGLFETEKLAIDVNTKEILYLEDNLTEADKKRKTQAALLDLKNGLCIPQVAAHSISLKNEGRLFRGLLRITQGLTIPTEYYPIIKQNMTYSPKEIDSFLLNHFLNNLDRKEKAFTFFMNLFLMVCEQTSDHPQTVKDMYDYFVSHFGKIAVVQNQGTPLQEAIHFLSPCKNKDFIYARESLIEFALFPSALRLIRGMLLLESICDQNIIPEKNHLKTAPYAYLLIENPLDCLLEAKEVWESIHQNANVKDEDKLRWVQFTQKILFKTNEPGDITVTLRERVIRAINILCDSNASYQRFKLSYIFLNRVKAAFPTEFEAFFAKLIPQIISGAAHPLLWSTLGQHPEFRLKVLKFLLNKNPLTALDCAKICEIVNLDLEIIFHAEIYQDFFAKIDALLQHQDFINIFKNMMLLASQKERAFYQDKKELRKVIAKTATASSSQLRKATTNANDILSIAKFVLLCEFDNAKPSLDSLVILSKKFVNNDKQLIFAVIEARVRNGEIDISLINNFMSSIDNHFSKNFGDGKSTEATLIAYWDAVLDKLAANPSSVIPDIEDFLSKIPSTMAENIASHVLSRLDTLFLRNRLAAITLAYKILQYDIKLTLSNHTRKESYWGRILLSMHFFFNQFDSLYEENDAKIQLAYFNWLKTSVTYDYLFSTDLNAPQNLEKVVKFYLKYQKNKIEEIVGLIKAIGSSHRILNSEQQSTDPFPADRVADILAPLITFAIEKQIDNSEFISEIINLLGPSAKFAKRNGKLFLHLFKAMNAFSNTKQQASATIHHYRGYLKFVSKLADYNIHLTEDSFSNPMDALEFIQVVSQVFSGSNELNREQVHFLAALINMSLYAQEILLCRHQASLDLPKKQDITKNILMLFSIMVQLYKYMKSRKDSLTSIDNCFVRMNLMIVNFLKNLPDEKQTYELVCDAYENVREVSAETRILFESVIVKLQFGFHKVKFKALSFADDSFTKKFLEFVTMFLAESTQLVDDDAKHRNNRIESIRLFSEFFARNQQDIIAMLQEGDKNAPVYIAMDDLFFTIKATTISFFTAGDYYEFLLLFSAACDLFQHAAPYLPPDYSALFFNQFKALFTKNKASVEYVRTAKDEKYDTLFTATKAYIQYLLTLEVSTAEQEMKRSTNAGYIATALQGNVRLRQDILSYFSKKGSFLYADPTAVNVKVPLLLLEMIHVIIRETNIEKMLHTDVLKSTFACSFHLAAFLPIHSADAAERDQARTAFCTTFNLFETLVTVALPSMPNCPESTFQKIIDNTVAVKKANLPLASMLQKPDLFDTAEASLKKMKAQQLVSYGNRYTGDSTLDEKIASLASTHDDILATMQSASSSSHSSRSSILAIDYF